MNWKEWRQTCDDNIQKKNTNRERERGRKRSNWRRNHSIRNFITVSKRFQRWSTFLFFGCARDLDMRKYAKDEVGFFQTRRVRARRIWLRTKTVIGFVSVLFPILFAQNSFTSTCDCLRPYVRTFSYRIPFYWHMTALWDKRSLLRNSFGNGQNGFAILLGITKCILFTTCFYSQQKIPGVILGSRE